MILVGAAIIGFLLGLVICYFKQLKTLYQKREELGAIGDVATGLGGLKTLYDKI